MRVKAIKHNPASRAHLKGNDMSNPPPLAAEIDAIREAYEAVCGTDYKDPRPAVSFLLTRVPRLLDALAERDAENTRLERETRDAKNETEMADGCLAMIREDLETLGEDMSATPPMNYNDAMRAVWAKERNRAVAADAEIARLQKQLGAERDAMQDEILSEVNWHSNEVAALESSAEGARMRILELERAIDARDAEIARLRGDKATADAAFLKMADKQLETLGLLENISEKVRALELEAREP